MVIVVDDVLVSVVVVRVAVDTVPVVEYGVPRHSAPRKYMPDVPSNKLVKAVCSVNTLHLPTEPR